VEALVRRCRSEGVLLDALAPVGASFMTVTLRDDLVLDSIMQSVHPVRIVCVPKAIIDLLLLVFLNLIGGDMTISLYFNHYVLDYIN
jgi:hypothetical protein